MAGQLFRDLPDFAEAPFYSHLRELRQEGRCSFHMPGGRCLPAWQDLDTTELEGTGDLAEPWGPLDLAQRRLAGLYQGQAAFFLTGGSSEGLAAALLALCARGGAVLAARQTHRSLLLAAWRFGLRVYFPEGEGEAAAASEGWRSPLAWPGPAAYRRVLERQPDIRCLLVTAPDYYGYVPDLEALEHLARDYSLPLLVDAAHGAHFPAAGRPLPATVLVLSAHKTLLAPTGAAYLICRDPRWTGPLRQALGLLRGSSPPLMLAAAGDWARAQLEQEGAACYQRQLAWMEDYLGVLPPACRRVQDPEQDPLHLVLELEPDYSALDLEAWLRAQGIDVEFADPERLVLLPSLQTEAADYQRLRRALETYFQQPAGSRPPAAEVWHLRATWRQLLGQLSGSREASAIHSCWPEAPAPVPLPQIEAPVKLYSGEELLGRRSAQAITPYPPGIPLIWPGEAWTAELLNSCQTCLSAGLGFHGLQMGEGPCRAINQLSAYCYLEDKER